MFGIHETKKVAQKAQKTPHNTDFKGDLIQIQANDLQSVVFCLKDGLIRFLLLGSWDDISLGKGIKINLAIDRENYRLLL